MKLSAKEQLKIIAKGADTIVIQEELLKKLEENRPLTVKLGLDPSAPDIHLGHAVVLRKIRQMQELGHNVVIIIGDFTGRIGDPTGKSKGRNALTEEQVQINAKTYQDQIFKVLLPEKTTVRFNSEWLSELRLQEVLELAGTTTVARILERNDFQNRYKSGAPIGLHEFFYPLMQAYDSIFIHADIELGGTDQTFNILMGRSLQKAMGQAEQVAIFMPILEGLDGVEKMSKSLGNYIGVNEPADVMFKKVMEVPDALILKYFDLATDEHPDRIAQIKAEMENGKNPRDVKLELADIITSLYHSKEEAQRARRFYDEAFASKGIPEDVPTLTLCGQTLEQNFDALLTAKLASSKSELRRLVAQGGVSINGEKCTDLSACIAKGDVLRLGKKKFVRMV